MIMPNPNFIAFNHVGEDYGFFTVIGRITLPRPHTRAVLSRPSVPPCDGGDREVLELTFEDTGSTHEETAERFVYFSEPGISHNTRVEIRCETGDQWAPILDRFV